MNRAYKLLLHACLHPHLPHRILHSVPFIFRLYEIAYVPVSSESRFHIEASTSSKVMSPELIGLSDDASASAMIPPQAQAQAQAGHVMKKKRGRPPKPKGSGTGAGERQDKHKEHVGKTDTDGSDPGRGGAHKGP